jgi:hypothetical protein
VLQRVDARREQKASHLWWVEFKQLPADLGRIEFVMTWEHLVAEGGAQPMRVGGDTRRISMKEGERHVFDYANLGSSGGHEPHRIFEVTASIVEDEAFAGERIGYDLWYRHTDDHGRTTTRRFQSSGRQGEIVETTFAPLRFPVPDTAPGVPALESILEVSASIQGRIRSDGSIDARFGAGRYVDTELAGSPRRGGIGDGGRKLVNLVPGETISLVLPVPRGRNGLTAKEVGADDSLNDELMIDSAKFYANHKDELIVTVTRER